MECGSTAKIPMERLPKTYQNQHLRKFVLKHACGSSADISCARSAHCVPMQFQFAFLSTDSLRVSFAMGFLATSPCVLYCIENNSGKQSSNFLEMYCAASEARAAGPFFSSFCFLYTILYLHFAVNSRSVLQPLKRTKKKRLRPPAESFSVDFWQTPERQTQLTRKIEKELVITVLTDKRRRGIASADWLEESDPETDALLQRAREAYPVLLLFVVLHGPVFVIWSSFRAPQGLKPPPGLTGALTLVLSSMRWRSKGSSEQCAELHRMATTIQADKPSGEL